MYLIAKTNYEKGLHIDMVFLIYELKKYTVETNFTPYFLI